MSDITYPIKILAKYEVKGTDKTWIIWKTEQEDFWGVWSKDHFDRWAYEKRTETKIEEYNFYHFHRKSIFVLDVICCINKIEAGQIEPYWSIENNNISSISSSPKNNDNQMNCVFCGEPTRKCGGWSYNPNIDYRICTKCGR